MSTAPSLPKTSRPPRAPRPPRPRIADQPLTVPFTIIVDTREQAPFSFTGLRADSKDHGRTLIIPVVRQALPTGDYSIVGFENLLCVERKSIADLYRTLAANRDRFEREHERMAAIIRAGGTAAVMIEATWPQILSPQSNSRLNPKTVFRTSLSWLARYGVPWIAMGSRRLAEIATFRLLEKSWGERAKERERSESCLSELF